MPQRSRPAPRRGPAGRKAKTGGRPPSAAKRLADIIGYGAAGAALARKLARAGVRTRADLKRPAVFARLPRESQARVRFNPVRGAPLAAAEAVAEEVRRRLVFALGGPARRFEVIPVGSVRRRAPRVKDLDFLVVVPAACGARADVLDAAALRPARAGDRVAIADTYAAGARRRSLILRVRQGARARHYRADLFLALSAEKPYALYHHTGARQFNIRTRALAKRKGWRLNQYGLFVAATDKKVPGSSRIKTERDLSEFLGVTHRLPADRI